MLGKEEVSGYWLLVNCYWLIVIAILAGVVKFLPHPNPPRTQGEGVRNSQMI